MPYPAKLIGAFIAALPLVSCVHVQVDEVNKTHASGDMAGAGFLAMTTHSEGSDRPAMLYVPRDYDASRAWPLIVFLHGAGERGSDGVRQTSVGIGPAILKNPDRFPCLVFMPQCPEGNWWGPIPGRTDDASSFGHITDGIEQIVARYNVDADRVSLTGLSMGGYGTFAYGAHHTDRFSAFMPICGGGDPAWAQPLASRPFWVIHGEADSVVPVARSQTMVDALKGHGAKVEFTVYPGVNHNSWDQAYSKEQGAIEWLLAQQR